MVSEGGSRRRWFSGKISRCHRDAPGLIPGRRIPYVHQTPWRGYLCARIIFGPPSLVVVQLPLSHRHARAQERCGESEHHCHRDVSQTPSTSGTTSRRERGMWRCDHEEEREMRLSHSCEGAAAWWEGQVRDARSEVYARSLVCVCEWRVSCLYCVVVVSLCCGIFFV